MTQATGKRRGHGEDSIYWDESKSRYVGAVSVGFSASGARLRKKVSGRTKTEVRDKLRELHQQVDSGLRSRRRYTVGDALEDWLDHGVDGLAPRTVTLYRGMDTPLGGPPATPSRFGRPSACGHAPAGFDKAVDGLTFMCGRPTAPRRCGMQDRTRSARSKSTDAKKPAAAHSTIVPPSLRDDRAP
jgi:hypothetical protein